MANQSSYQKRRAEVLSLRSYVKRYEAKIKSLEFELETEKLKYQNLKELYNESKNV